MSATRSFDEYGQQPETPPEHRDEPATGSTAVSPGVKDCAVYVDGQRLPTHHTYQAAISEVRHRDDGFVWLGLHEPELAELEAIATTFGLHELAVEDAVNAHQRPKLEHYDTTLFMVLRPVDYFAYEAPDTTNQVVETGELMVFLGHDFIITVRHGDHAPLRRLRAHLDSHPEQLRTGPAAVLLAIADHIVDHYLDVSEQFADDIDDMAEAVFTPHSIVSTEQVYFVKRELLKLRRAVAPLAVPVQRLAEGYSELIPVETRSYFRNVADHISTVSDRITHFDDLLTTLVEATTAMLALQQNTDMRKITAWAAIIAVPTALAGVYGMNFDNMPETHWSYGYPMALGVMLALCLLLYTVFRRNRWL